MGLKKTRQQGHTAQTIAPMVKAVRTVHPKAGIQEMISLLRQEHNIMVSRYVYVFTFYELLLE